LAIKPRAGATGVQAGAAAEEVPAPEPKTGPHGQVATRGAAARKAPASAVHPDATLIE
jgi:hypothetical protein